MKKIINKIIAILLIINTSLFIISFSISIPILFRPFYYIQIDLLDIKEETGYSYEEIKEAYDDVIDYCLLNKEFKTGKLKYSNEGKSHFRDCKILFIINFVILIISGIIYILKKKLFNNIKLFNCNIEFCSSVLIIFIFLSLLISSFVIGFNDMFTIFHNIFFLGKDNWILDPDTDEIIDILPKHFFMNCAILVISIIFIITISFIIIEIINKKRKKS
jgi:integral membrane protein (TIGR01906 family)